MSLIEGYLNQIGKYYISPEFYEGPVLEEIPVGEVDLGVPFKVKFTLSATVNLNVDLVGTYEGEPQEDTLVFSASWGDTVMVSAVFFDELTSPITTDIGANERNCWIVAADAAGEEMPGAWVEFPCRWVDKTSSYLKVEGDVVTGEIAVSDAKVLCEVPLKDGDKVRQVQNGVDGIIYEVKKMKPAIGLSGAEEFRTLLLGGVGE